MSEYRIEDFNGGFDVFQDNRFVLHTTTRNQAEIVIGMLAENERLRAEKEKSTILWNVLVNDYENAKKEISRFEGVIFSAKASIANAQWAIEEKKDIERALGILDRAFESRGDES